jgi:hypothetical protein
MLSAGWGLTSSGNGAGVGVGGLPRVLGLTFLEG